MENILIIGAGVFQFPLVQAASKKYNVLLAAPIIDDKFKPYITEGFITDVRDGENIYQYAKDKHVVGVITDQTDIAVRSVAYVAEKLGLPGIGYETSCLFTDKALQRRKMRELGIKLLPNKEVENVDEAIAFFNEIKKSVIIKPVDNQGSRGVARCDSEEDVRNKWTDTIKWSKSRKAIIEQRATGREFVVEGIAVNYEFQNLNCGDTLYFDIPDAYAAKTRIFPTNADDELRDRVLDLNKRIITGFGLKQGITHSEFIMEGDDIYLIETAARGGGVFISSDLISLSTGLDTEQFLLEIATGVRDSLPEFKFNKQACGYMAFYIPDGVINDIKGKDEILGYDFVHRNQLDELYTGRKCTGGQNDKTTRLAIIVSGETLKLVDERMALIKKTLRVTVETAEGKKGLIWE